MSDMYQRIKSRAFSDRSNNMKEQRERRTVLQDRLPDSSFQQTIRIIVGAVCSLLVIRFLLALFGAPPANRIVNMLYATTDVFVGPFQSMFSSTTRVGNANFEIETLVAILIYILFGAVMISLLQLREGSDYVDKN